MTNQCQYCSKEIINSYAKVCIPSITKEKHAQRCCVECLWYLKVAQLIVIDPYAYMITPDKKVYEININLDINGKLVYIRFNDGNIIKEYTNRVIEVGIVPDKLKDFVISNCTITEKPNGKMMKLPKFIGVRKRGNNNG